MSPIELQTTREVLERIADRVRTLRVMRGWTQVDLAERSGVAVKTYRVFETSGRISLERLVRIATVLDALAGFDHLFRLPAVRSLEELEQRSRKPARKRARPRRAQS